MVMTVMECKSSRGWQPFGTPTTLLYICLITETCCANVEKILKHLTIIHPLQASKKIHFSAAQRYHQTCPLQSANHLEVEDTNIVFKMESS